MVVAAADHLVTAAAVDHPAAGIAVDLPAAGAAEGSVVSKPGYN